MKPCEFHLQQLTANGYGPGVGTVVSMCVTHGVQTPNTMYGQTPGARCVVGKCEDAAAAVIDGLEKRIAALEAKS